ncbi:MAG TPA: hypothetical protein H9886_00665 [Candidatus Faecalicoccus intestinipullorum]|nr:hypothetical protein [Candidatus Faecalicoccus intestinipullorum]
MSETIKYFDGVSFNLNDKTMTIENGTNGTFDYRRIKRALVLNEKAKFKGSQPPFTQLLPHGPGIPAILTDPYVYVGVKIVMDDETILCVYTSKEETQTGTDQYIEDRKRAKEIEAFLRKIIHKYQPSET